MCCKQGRVVNVFHAAEPSVSYGAIAPRVTETDEGRGELTAGLTLRPGTVHD